MKCGNIRLSGLAIVQSGALRHPSISTVSFEEMATTRALFRGVLPPMSHLSILILAAMLGQLPTESRWLDAVPPDADIVRPSRM
jgi:hypothetical protein